jgi:hypothetical protein
MMNKAPKILIVLLLLCSLLPAASAQAQEPFLYSPLDVNWWTFMSTMMDHKCPLDTWDGEIWTYLDATSPSDPTVGRPLCSADEGAAATSASSECKSPEEKLRVSSDAWAWFDSHEGYDWSVLPNTPVYAAADGVVTCAGWGKDCGHRTCYGYVVIIQHANGYQTFYAHLAPDTENPNLLPGWPNVTARDQIALSGNSVGVGCNSTGAHLHFSVLRDGKYVDPFGWQEWGWTVPDPLDSCALGQSGPRLWLDGWPHRPGELPKVYTSVPPRLRPGDAVVASTAPSSGTDAAKFISDVTHPDSNVLAPGETLIKTWRLQNTSGKSWGQGYKLIFMGGEQMGGRYVLDAPVTKPGETADFSISVTAPALSGQYWGNWRLRNPGGIFFGPTVWVEVNVQAATDQGEIELVSLSYPKIVEPGQMFEAHAVVKLNQGRLLESRGDMLLNSDGALLQTDWPYLPVAGKVGEGETYTFSFVGDHALTAPTTEGFYSPEWHIWADGKFIGPEIKLEFQVFDSSYLHPPLLNSPTDYHQSQEVPLFCAVGQSAPGGEVISSYQFEFVTGSTAWQSAWVSPPINCTMPPEMEMGHYTWRARVRDGKGSISPWSSVYHFTRLGPLDFASLKFDRPAPPTN